MIFTNIGFTENQTTHTRTEIVKVVHLKKGKQIVLSKEKKGCPLKNQGYHSLLAVTEVSIAAWVKFAAIYSATRAILVKWFKKKGCRLDLHI